MSNVNAPVLEQEKHSLDELSDTENDNGEGDLDMLIFGNPELPSNILNHLPNLNLAGPKKVTKIEHEINIDEDTVREENNPEIERVLIVVDEPFNLDALKIILQCATADIPHFNFRNRVETASNGVRAVEAFKKAYKDGFSVKLILMDCNMPKMDGY